MTSTRILIVEDEAITAMDLERELVSLGYTVVGICDQAQDAVAAATDLKPDLVLMDIHLNGEIDGIAAASAIRGNEDVPVVFLTAHSDQVTLDRALAAAPFGYVLKPFQTRELKVAIEVARYKHTKEAETRRLVRELEEALAKVKLLSGLLPICSTCKRIRDEAARWLPVEQYIRAHSDADFSHGLCPECETNVLALLERDVGS
jgi:AmiR/NasT family two-component response regulator